MSNKCPANLSSLNSSLH